jgi:flagellum-specific ATP synthase
MHDLADQIDDLLEREVFGRVIGIQGLLVEIAGPLHLLAVGARLSIEVSADRQVLVEIVGFKPERALCLPYDALDGIRLGCRAVLVASAAMAKPSDAWLGRGDRCAGSTHRWARHASAGGRRL